MSGHSWNRWDDTCRNCGKSWEEDKASDCSVVLTVGEPLVQVPVVGYLVNVTAVNHPPEDEPKKELTPAPQSLPSFDDGFLPDEFPVIDANAQLTLPSEIYAPWFRAIQVWLGKAGAEQGVDYKAIVSTAGVDDKRRHLFRVQWKALTEKGVLYLNLMAQTLTLLEAEAKQLGHEPKSGEKPQENG